MLDPDARLVALAGLPARKKTGPSGEPATPVVATWADISASEKTLLAPGWEAGNADSIYALFQSGAGGTFCGGVAWTMVRVYRVFGFTSWVYHHGTKTGWPVGHSTTLVRVGNQILVEDAYFNHTYVDSRGGPLDVRDVVRLTRAKRLGAIRRTEPKTAPDGDILYGSDDYQQALRGEGWLAHSWPRGDQRNPHDCSRTALGYTKCELAGVNWLRFQRFYWPWMERYYPEATKTLTRPDVPEGDQTHYRDASGACL